MVDRDRILLIHSRDLTSPFGATWAHYQADHLSRSRTVHVLCRVRPTHRDAGTAPEDAVFHDIYTGEIPVVSGLLFVLLSSVYAALLGVRYRYDAVYCFQGELIQGWIGSVAADSRFIVGLQSVPVRQARDLARNSGDRWSIRRAASLRLRSLYALPVGPLIERATEVICLTDGIREVTERTHDIDLSGAHIIGMGIDTERFAVDSPLGREPPRNRTWQVIYVGTIHGTRGLDDVIEGIATSEYDIDLRIAGGGRTEHIESLEAHAEALGVGASVEFLGLVPHEAVPKLLRTADIAVSPLPDIQSYRISFPAKLLEYMAAGCLVIATRIPPHERLIEDGTNGFLYEADSSSFRRAVERCIECQDRHPSIRREARRTAEAHRWSEIVAQHEHVIFRSGGGSGPEEREAP